MKQVFAFVLGVLFLGAVSVRADSFSVTVAATGGVAKASSIGAIPISGTIDKIELYDTAASSTSTAVTLTGQNGAGTIGDTLVNVSSWNSSSSKGKVVFPRFLPTDNTGTALAVASTATGTGTNVSTIININYEPKMVSGNLVLTVTPNTAQDATVTAVIYYKPARP